MDNTYLAREIKWLMRDAELNIIRAKQYLKQGFTYTAGKRVIETLEAIRVASLHTDALDTANDHGSSLTS